MKTATEIRLAGAPNFRDIGGWETTDGRRVRPGRMFRSGELSNLMDADFDILRRLRVGCVVDLRSQNESSVHPSSLPDDILTVRHLADISADIRVDGRSIFELLSKCTTVADAAPILLHTFLTLPARCGPALGYIAEKLATEDAPVLFHCTNGRDRTGVVAALLLALLGTSREVIVADFMLTNERIDVEKVIANSIQVFRNVGLEIDRRVIELVTLVKPQFIEVLFAGIDTEFGSLESYFDAFGIDASRRAALRERLVS